MPTPPTSVQEISNPGYLFPAFRPVELTLQSIELIDAENASLVIDCTAVPTGTVLTINGYRFTAVDKIYEELLYGEFQSMAPTDYITSRSLQLAILATPLAQDYLVTEIGQQDGTVTLRAKKDGPAYNLTAVVVSGTIGVTPYDANPTTVSQQVNLLNWGVFVNPYILEATRSYGAEGVVDDYTMTALPRLELPYAPANRYVFDLGAYVRAYLRPTLTTDQGSWQYTRMVGVAARYGGIWADPNAAYRKEWEDYRYPPGGYSTGTYIGGGVAWGVASTGYLADGTNCFQHEQHQLARPLYAYYDEDYADTVYLPYFSVFTAANVDVFWRAQWLRSSGTTFSTDSSIDTGLNRGGIHDLGTFPTLAGDVLPYQLDEVTVEMLDPYDTDSVIDTLRFVNCAGPDDLWLGFVSRCGGFERWNFTPDPDEAQKRVLTTYSPADGTTRMANVDLTKTTRLYSRGLTKEQWDFLVVELQASPSVYLVSRNNYPQPVVVTDFDSKADPETRFYSLSLEITPADPLLTVSN